MVGSHAAYILANYHLKPVIFIICYNFYVAIDNTER